MSAAVPAETGATAYYVLDEAPHGDGGSTALGFWIYLMSDTLIFAGLFAAYGVLGAHYAAGPSPRDLFELPLVAINTAMLLLSSLACGIAMLAVDAGGKRAALGWLVVTALFGVAFLAIELHEFAGLIADGATPQRSAFLSAFFILVGTHGLHVASGLVWVTVLMVQVATHGLIPANRRRLMCFSMFWHFLDVIWIGVFTFVYLLGMLR